MCGISGIVLSKGKCDEFQLMNSINTIRYRGPDGVGVKLLANDSVGLAHRRLSIIDLSEAGHQPMCNEDGSIWITFNGEIYNYKLLKQKLVANGHCFKSHSDTEVLIHGYEEWGEELLSKIEGMFALAIWDENKNQLLLARDRLGIKPLYYYKDESSFIFASELKAMYPFHQFKRDLNYKALIDYLHFYVIPAPATIWNNTYKLKPGTYLTINLSGEIEQTSYWSIKPGNTIVDEQRAIENTNDLVTKSVQSHLESDVPIGLFLSSGYDSTTLLAYLKEYRESVNTFSIGFKDSLKSEHKEASWIAEHFSTSHHELVLDEQFLNVTEDLFNYYDEPYAVSSMVSYYYVSKLASSYNKVVFAGDGGDEVFGGYKWYREINKDFINRSWWRKIFLSSTNQLKDYYQKAYFKYMGTDLEWVNSILSPDAQVYYPANPMACFDLPDEYWHLNPVKVFQLLDYKFFVPDVALPRSDRSSMATSLEVRVPMLDHNLVDYTMDLDVNVYFKPDVKKYLLFENMKNRVPNRVLELPKKGFGNPLDNFFKQRVRISDEIKNSKLFSQVGVFVQIDFERLNKKQLWLLYCLSIWYAKWS
jgi:asparagine synthase (glutamine-hydrolysing)